MDMDRRFFERYEEFSDIGNYIEGLHTDILIYAPAEIESIKDGRFIRNALSEGIVVYGNWLRKIGFLVTGYLWPRSH